MRKYEVVVLNFQHGEDVTKDTETLKQCRITCLPRPHLCRSRGHRGGNKQVLRDDSHHCGKKIKIKINFAGVSQK